MSLQREMMELDRPIYLLIDNCSAHRVTIEPFSEQDLHGIKVATIPHIYIIYFPPNCTSFVQQMDQVII